MYKVQELLLIVIIPDKYSTGVIYSTAVPNQKGTIEMSQSPTEPINQLLPYNKVISRITTEEAAQTAVASLVTAGFPEEKTYLLHGEQGRRYIDIDGSGHGVFGRLMRSYQRLQGNEKKMIDDADEGHEVVEHR